LPELLSFEVAGAGAIPERLLAASRAEASAVGYAHGWSTGIREARASMAAEVAQAGAAQRQLADDRQAALSAALRSVTHAANTLEAGLAPSFDEIERLILGAAVEIAEALVGRELRDVDEAGRAALARALQLVPQGESVTIRLHPEVYAALTDNEQPSQPISGRTITLEPDSTLARGDAVAVCGATTIDARLAEGVRRVRERLAP
jgi:flagellar assembly protein FliH